MKNDIKLECGNIDDLEDVVKFNHEIFKGMYENKPYSLKQYQERLKNKKPLILLAKDGEKIVGNAIAFEQEDYWYHWIMGVAKEYRGQGIGKQLLEKREKYAIKRGYKSIRAKVYNISEAMKHIYKQRGYNVINIEKSVTDPKYDALTFELKITA